jgi:hypothetical protein
LPTPQELGKWDYINTQTGELNIATKTITFDGSEEWWQSSYGNSGDYYFTIGLPTTKGDTTQVVCNLFETAGSGTAGSGVFVTNINGRRVLVIAVQTAMQFADVEAFKRYLVSQNSQGNPLKVAYKVETPNITNIAIDKSYVAYNNGSETVVQGAIDNSQYKALCSIDNEYIIFLGGNK